MPALDVTSTGAVRFVASVAELDRAQWNACFKNEIENYDYHHGVERSGVGGFEFGWYVIENAGHIICAAPAFTTRYDLATTAQGAVRTVLQRIQPWVPGRLTLALSCLGSPVTERCQIGFSPELDRAARNAVLTQLIDHWRQHAASSGISLLGLKDLSQSDSDGFAQALAASGFRMTASMPSASLKIDFDSEEAYLGKLSSATRKDMRRKLKSRDNIRVERVCEAEHLLGEIMEMYQETRARSDWAFESLDASYFSNVVEDMKGAAFFTLYWAGDKLVAANLLIGANHRLLDKFFVMRGDEGRRHNLYFLSWFENIRYCLAHGLTVYESGQAGYETKLRLGSELHRNWLGFHHGNRIVQGLLGMAAPLLAVDQPDDKGAGTGASKA